MASLSILASHSKYLQQCVSKHFVHAFVLYQCPSRTLSYRDFLGHTAEATSKSSENARLEWAKRVLSESMLHSATKVRVRFSARQYSPCVRELLRGLWSLDKDPIWLLVDQLVATGKPYNMSDTCPEFPHWQHVIQAPDFFAAVTSLIAQGHLPLLRLDTEEEEKEERGDEVEEDRNDSRMDAMPVWLAMYLVSAKLDTRAAAHAGVALAISQIESTPTHLRAPLLLLTMCAVSDHGLTAQVPAVLQAFQDIFSSTRREPLTILDAQGSHIFQYNSLLTLLSRFPLKPQIASHVDRLLRQMHTKGVLLETTTATRLITSRGTATFLVQTVREILKAQEVAPSAALSVSLTRYFSKRRDHREVAKHIFLARGVDPLAHAKTYLLSFRDVAASVGYLRTLELERPPSRSRYSKEDCQPVQLRSPASTLSARLSRRGETSQATPVVPPKMRHLYTSMLFAAALSKTISTNTFCSMADSVRAAHGADKVLETVVLVGFLRRHAWDQAREQWNTWEKKSMQLRRVVDETEAFLDRREKTFGDVSAVRKTINLTEFESFLLRRSAYRMKVDSTALAAIVRAVAGSDTAGLLEAFEVMDAYAVKTNLAPSTNQYEKAEDMDDARFRPHDVRLTSRVVNCFLMRAFGRRRPDIVFRSWDTMTHYYGVEVSVPTLELVLRSARIAASMEQSLVSVIPRWLLRGTLRDALPAGTFQDFGDEIRWMLSPECRPGTRWNSMPAWRVARRVFREDILFANWPWLRDIAVPAQAMRGDSATSHLDALQELAMGDTHVKGIGHYPHIVPRARTFREYVLLLGRVQRSSEIPQVLAWMRALEVRPSRHMLSLCLALWAEVGMGSPADDVWIEKIHASGELQHGGEYGRLVAWLEEWLGPDEVPNDAEAISSLNYVHELEQRERIRY